MKNEEEQTKQLFNKTKTKPKQNHPKTFVYFFSLLFGNANCKTEEKMNDFFVDNKQIKQQPKTIFSGGRIGSRVR